MIPKTLNSYSDAELVRRFVENAIETDQASILNKPRKFKPLYHECMAIKEELRSRDGDKRRLLVALYDHENLQVQFNAAEATLAIDPSAKSVVERVAASNWYPAAAHARECLLILEHGTYMERTRRSQS